VLTLYAVALSAYTIIAVIGCALSVVPAVTVTGEATVAPFTGAQIVTEGETGLSVHGAAMAAIGSSKVQSTKTSMKHGRASCRNPDCCPTKRSAKSEVARVISVSFCEILSSTEMHGALGRRPRQSKHLVNVSKNAQCSVQQAGQGNGNSKQ
jgi:hypothetical protein